MSHVSFICVTWLIHMCDMAHSYVWHDPFICVTWPIHMCDMTHSYVWHDPFICVTWPIHMCDTTDLCLTIDLIGRSTPIGTRIGKRKVNRHANTKPKVDRHTEQILIWKLKVIRLKFIILDMKAQSHMDMKAQRNHMDMKAPSHEAHGTIHSCAYWLGASVNRHTDVLFRVSADVERHIQIVPYAYWLVLCNMSRLHSKKYVATCLNMSLLLNSPIKETVFVCLLTWSVISRLFRMPIGLDIRIVRNMHMGHVSQNESQCTFALWDMCPWGGLLTV